LLVFGIALGDDYAYHMNNFGIVAKVNELLVASPILSIGILILTLAMATVVKEACGLFVLIPRPLS